ncbi:MAG: glucose-6-phosphate isomerase [Clostridiales bacterium]|nr:glucose-6-phosphate isomerase [Clostridiales bacterium]
MIKIDLSGVLKFTGILPRSDAKAADERSAQLPMSGWMSWPREITRREIDAITEAGRTIARSSQALVVLGAGGSSLGARALTDALFRDGGVPDILFGGDNLSGEYMSRLLKKLESKDFSVVVTSKTGSTTETLATLRIFLKLLRERYGAEALSRLYVTTGAGPSALRRFAEEKGCALFDIPREIGGRYSVLTASGLLTAAAGGLDITALIDGAVREMESNAEAAWDYAAARQSLYRGGFKTELFASFEPALGSFGDWWRQLYGESEGKEGRGIFPAPLHYTGDLHSMGQYVQEGPRDLFETIVSLGEAGGDVAIPGNGEFDDGFDFLTGRSLNSVNEIALGAVKNTHISGGVPVIEIRAPKLDESSLGALMYFFERACASSAILSGVTPFEQPGVEAYKKQMFQMLKD